MIPELIPGTHAFFLRGEESLALGWRFVEHEAQLELGTGGEPVQHQLLVETCEEFIEVELIPRLAGERKARIHFRGAPYRTLTRTWSPDSGLLRFGYRPRELKQSVLLWASAESGDFSETLVLDAARLPSLVRLELKQGASLEVNLLDHNGLPAVDQVVSLTPIREHAYQQDGKAQTSNTLGQVRFEHLAPGQSTVRVRQKGGHFRTHEFLTLGPGEFRSLELKLPPEVPLAASGVLEDELGHPLGGRYVHVQTRGPERPWIDSVKTEDDGRFALFMEPCESILLNPNLSARGDTFAPASIEVDHGSEGLVFRRTSAAVERSFRVLAVDRHTGERLGKVVPTFDLGPGSEAMANTYGANTNFSVFVQANTRMRLAVPGYHRLEVDLVLALADLEADQPLRVEMSPGLRMRVRVHDAETELPLEGAELRSLRGERFRSAADGWVEVESSLWSPFEVSKAGYESQECDPELVVLWNDDQFYLMPEEEER